MSEDPKGAKFQGSYNTQERTVRMTLKMTPDSPEQLVLTTDPDGSITFYDPFEEPILSFHMTENWEARKVFEAMDSTWHENMGIATMNAFNAFMAAITPMLQALIQRQEENENAEGEERIEGRRPTLQ